jgi:aspartate/methionine/tyrosine aminotransferase
MLFNPQAEELNTAINSANPHVFAMLCERGKGIYFPKKGILAQSAEAAGKKINATIGTALEDDGQPMVLNGLKSQLSGVPSSSFNYAPSPGRPDFRKAWQDLLLKKNPSLKDTAISLPVVTSALTHGLSMAGYLFTDEQDTLVIPDLYWENYDLIFKEAYGARIITYPTFQSGGYNIEGLRAAVKSATGPKKIIVLNFPNNPSGYTATDKEALAIRDLVKETAEAGSDVLVLIDDAYFGLVYEEGVLKESVFTLLSNLHERVLAVKLDGPTKEDYVWGFRLGFVTFGCAKSTPAMYSALESKLAGAIRGNISNANNLGQTMLLKAWTQEGYDAEKTAKYAMLKQRCQRIRDILAAKPEYARVFEALPFNSGYFMCVRFKKDAEPVRQLLLSKYGVGTIVFGPVMRLAYSAVPIDKIDEMMECVFKAGQESI